MDLGRPFSLALALLFPASVLAAAGPAAAAVPPFGEPELQARSNFSGAFNLPDSSFFNSSTPGLDDEGRVVIKVGVLAGGSSQGIWAGGGGEGGIVYTSPGGAFLSDAAVGAGGRVVFEQVFSTPDGIFFHDLGTPMQGLLTDLPLGADDWSSPQINAAGQVGFRAGFSGDHAFASFDGMAVMIHATEASLDAGSPYSFLFTPSFNDERRIAAKVRLGGAGQVGGERPDEIRVFDETGASVLVAADRDSDPASDFLSFDNSVSLTEDGRVAFIAALEGGVRGVFLADSAERGSGILEIARDDSPEVTEIEFFAPAANTLGWVAFRGRDAEGLRAVFVGDGVTLRRVIGEHDLVATDLGTARIDQHDASPVFGGSPALSDLGQLAFAAGLTPPDNNQIEWGSGLFVADSAGIFANGFEGGDLSAWAATQP